MTQQFKVGQLVIKSGSLCEVRHYEPKNNKYLIIQHTPIFAWSGMWVQPYKLKPLMHTIVSHVK